MQFLFLFQMDTESKNRELKHLGFVRVAAIQILVCMSNLYDYAKQNLGPLRSMVGTVEGAVTTVVGPVYEKLKDGPDDFLALVDKKVFDRKVLVSIRSILLFIYFFTLLSVYIWRNLSTYFLFPKSWLLRKFSSQNLNCSGDFLT